MIFPFSKIPSFNVLLLPVKDDDVISILPVFKWIWRPFLPLSLTHICARFCEHVSCTWAPKDNRTGCRIPWKWSYRWIPGVPHGCWEPNLRVGPPLNCWALSPACFSPVPHLSCGSHCLNSSFWIMPTVQTVEIYTVHRDCFILCPISCETFIFSASTLMPLGILLFSQWVQMTHWVIHLHIFHTVFEMLSSLLGCAAWQKWLKKGRPLGPSVDHSPLHGWSYGSENIRQITLPLWARNREVNAGA